MSTNPSRSRPPPGFLARVPVSELKLVRVAVRRGNVTTSAPPGPIERSIDDPKHLIPLIHLKKDETRRSMSIFDREDVLVNQENRFILADANILDPQGSHNSRGYSHSKSTSPRRDRSDSSNYRRRSKSSSQSRNVDKDRQTHFDVYAEKRKSLERDGDRRLDRDNNRNVDRRTSVERNSEKRPDRRGSSAERDRDRRYRSRLHSREREEDRYRHRSRTPLRPGEYRPPRSELRRRSRSREKEVHDKYRSHPRRSRSLSRDKYKKYPSPDIHKPSTSRKPSRSPRRSRSPSRGRDRAKYGESSKRWRSKSPSNPDKPYYVERQGRERSPGYKSPEKRRSRSPSKYEGDRRRSRTPSRYSEGSRGRSSPGRYERYSRRHSRSPDRYESYRGPPDKRARSPHPPIVTFSRSRSDLKRQNRSPAYDRDKSYRSDKHRRSRSQSPRKRHKNEATHGDPNPEFAFYEGIPGSEFWIPGPIRAGIPANARFYPPALYPRIPGAPPIFLPFRNPMMAPYPVFRPRLPVYNSKYKQKVMPQIQSGGDNAPSTSGVSSNPSTSTGNAGEASASQRISEVDVRQDENNERKGPEEGPKDLHAKD